MTKTGKPWSRSLRMLALAAAACFVAGGFAHGQAPTAVPRVPVTTAPLSASAEQVYGAARSKILQIRTLVTVAGEQSTIGSGFLVSADGLAVTNYHVVSQYALEPQSYRLEYVAADGGRGSLTLVAIDVANDLAVVRLEKPADVFLAFDERALTGGLPHGERLYSLGNPLDLGFTITEGTYNGLVERSYNERIHFSGALNPGMSGGPTVTADGRVAGVNVAKRLGGELVGFLVPASFAATLLERARNSDPLSPAEVRAEIGRQLTAWQTGFFTAIEQRGFRQNRYGPYRAPDSAAPWFNCWARTNDGQIPKPRAALNMTSCNSDTRLFVAGDLTVGGLQVSHSYYRGVDLNQFQFAAFLSGQQAPTGWGSGRKWHTKERCREDFLGGDENPPMRVVWCARAYREFDGLFDVRVTSITQDRGTEALVSRLSISGVTFDNAMSLTRRFLDAVTWTK